MISEGREQEKDGCLTYPPVLRDLDNEAEHIPMSILTCLHIGSTLLEEMFKEDLHSQWLLSRFPCQRWWIRGLCRRSSPGLLTVDAKRMIEHFECYL